VKSILNSLNLDTLTKDVAADAEMDKFCVFHELVHFYLDHKMRETVANLFVFSLENFITTDFISFI
jgi:hypothetical protein